MDKLEEDKRKREREKKEPAIHDQYVEEKKYWMDKKAKAFDKKQEVSLSSEKGGGKENSYIFPTIASCTSSEEEEGEGEGERKDDITKQEDENANFHHHHHRSHHRRKRHHRSRHNSK